MVNKCASRWKLVVLSAAILVGACGSNSPTEVAAPDTVGTEEAPATTAAPTSLASSTTESSVAVETSTIATATSEVQATPPTFVPGAPAIEAGGNGPGRLPEGANLVNSLGADFTIELPSGFSRGGPDNFPSLSLWGGGSTGGSDRVLTFRRFGFLADPNDATSSVDEWPVDDIEGWLDAVTYFEVTNREEVKVGGRDAVRFDLASDASLACTLYCVGFGDEKLKVEQLSRVWWMPIPGENPLVAIAAVESDLYRNRWFEISTSIMATLAFSDSSSEPAPVVPVIDPVCDDQLIAGQTTIGSGGGLSISVGDEPQYIIQNVAPCVLAIIYDDDPNDQVRIMLAGKLLDGTVVTTTDQITAALTATGVDVRELESTTVAESPTRVFDLANGTGEIVLAPLGLELIDPESDVGLNGPTAGRLWVIESPRGLLVVSGASYGLGLGVQETIAKAEGIVASMDFADVG